MVDALPHDGKDPALTIRASWGSYAVFCGVWVVLTAGYALLAWYRPGSGAPKGAWIAAAVGCASVLWVAGHRVRVASGVLEYRDGFFRSRTIRVADIETLSHGSQRRKILQTEIATPLLTVVARNRAQSFHINPKPFSRDGLRALQRLVRPEARRRAPSRGRRTPRKGVAVHRPFRGKNGQ